MFLYYECMREFLDLFQAHKYFAVGTYFWFWPFLKIRTVAGNLTGRVKHHHHSAVQWMAKLVLTLLEITSNWGYLTFCCISHKHIQLLDFAKAECDLTFGWSQKRLSRIRPREYGWETSKTQPKIKHTQNNPHFI